MKYIFFLLINMFLIATISAQQITFSEYNKKDGRDMNFEILGRFGNNFLIYKNINRKNYLVTYDDSMRIIKTSHLDYITEKTFNVDFIIYPDFFYMIYQYEKNNVVYCKAVRLNAAGEKSAEPIQLDTTRLSILADNKIYTTIFSEDRKKIMIYKRQVKNETMMLTTKLFDANLLMLDSTRRVMKFDDRREIYSELTLANSGNFIFAKETKKSLKDNSSKLNIILHKPGIDSARDYSMLLNDKFIDDVSVKVDNLNQHYIINSFYHGKRQGTVEGLFTALIDMTEAKPIKAAFNVFSDSLRYRLNTSDQYRFAFDNLTIRNTVVKKKGGFILAAEDFYMETQYNNVWNRRYYNYDYMTQGAASDAYYYSNPYYYGYRPYNSLNRDQSIRYYYNDIVVLSLNDSLKLEWNNIIHKQQYDVDDDNFLSFSNMNAGGEIHFFFIDKDRKKQIISDQSIFPDGMVKRYPTLKSNEMGYGFLPRLGKQVGARQMIIPYLYLGYVAFAKIDFPE